MPTGVALHDAQARLLAAAERVLERDGVDALTSRAVTDFIATPCDRLWPAMEGCGASAERTGIGGDLGTKQGGRGDRPIACGLNTWSPATIAIAAPLHAASSA